mmetsp:Transcript_46664/g.133520  ORF Transcript_46664/g.133520 Transcript_46664/m.133520 type:complete len:283 (-) Transcript_46664:3004-3852(-)
MGVVATSEPSRLVQTNLDRDVLPSLLQSPLQIRDVLLHAVIAGEVDRLQLAVCVLRQRPFHAANDSRTDTARKSQHLQGGVRPQHLSHGLPAQFGAVQPERGDAAILTQGRAQEFTIARPDSVAVELEDLQRRVPMQHRCERPKALDPDGIVHRVEPCQGRVHLSERLGNGDGGLCLHIVIAELQRREAAVRPERLCERPAASSSELVAPDPQRLQARVFLYGLSNLRARLGADAIFCNAQVFQRLVRPQCFRKSSPAHVAELVLRDPQSVERGISLQGNRD